jgi:ferredoxin--NADP+ reductase
MTKYRIAVVGAGPAGFFTAKAFQDTQKEDLTFEIDMVERLPTPWGLVRNGVAPDHPKIKSVSKVFENIAKHENFRLFANIELGKDLSVKDLKENYDAVILATGSSTGRKLDIVGEELAGCISSAEFVPWYNAHPDYTSLEVDLSCDTAVIIGTGNVAIDIARMLLIDPTYLKSTDIAEHALVKLNGSKIKNVIICGSRGPENASFSASELRSLLNLENVDIHIDSLQIDQANLRCNQIGTIEKDLRKNLDVMGFIAEQVKNDYEKKLVFKFLATPKEIIGDSKVKRVGFAINELKDGKLIETSKSFSVDTGLVITAIGYNSLDYGGVRFENGRIKNIAGHVEHNVYTTGWAKRGPIGVIGTNKSDAADVVELIISNLGKPKEGKSINALVKPNHQIINQVGWEKINASEVISGEIVGKPRIKVSDWKRLISLGTSK